MKLSCGHYYGEVVRKSKVAGLVLTETRYAPGTRLPRHSHENAYLCLVRRGSYHEQYGSRSRTCGPLTLVFHPPDEVHSEAFHDAEVLSFNVEVPARWACRVHEHTPVLAQPLDFQGGPLAGMALRLYREFHQPDGVSPLAVEGLALELLAEASRGSLRAPGPRRPPWVEEVRDLLHSRFAEPLALADLGRLVNVHPVYVATAFRKHFGCTVGQYVRRRRVEYACRQMARTDAPLAEIALAAGFADQSHFSRTFKGHMGLTPAAYRRTVGRG